MWVHAEAPIDDKTNLKNGDLALFVRVGSDVKNNYYEYEIPLELTPPGSYDNYSSEDRTIVWPISNFLNVPFDVFTDIMVARTRGKVFPAAAKLSAPV